MIFGFLFLTISTCWNPWLIPDETQRSGVVSQTSNFS
jgi:hypothetical protein